MASPTTTSKANADSRVIFAGNEAHTKLLWALELGSVWGKLFFIFLLSLLPSQLACFEQINILGADSGEIFLFFAAVFCSCFEQALWCPCNLPVVSQPAHSWIGLPNLCICQQEILVSVCLTEFVWGVRGSTAAALFVFAVEQKKRW